MVRGHLRRGWRTLGLRTGILAVGWWSLDQRDPAGAAFGAFVVLSALLASVLLPSVGAARWRPAGVLRFGFVFLIDSIRGGLDVARRALARRPALSPTMIRYAVRLPEGTPRNLFAGVLSLMPGTLSVVLEDRQLAIHVLAEDAGTLRLLERLERSIARAVGERLESSGA
jgi:multicomponent Na+:H+ antiporter subunit E